MNQVATQEFNQVPIQTLLPEIQRTLAENTQLILQAPTGAGKSTALPLAMLDWPEIEGKILMLEPRRIAARSVAHFIAARRGEPVGQSVGFRVRGESSVSAKTRLEVVTEGVLTRMIQQDPELSGYGLIIFDEIHERHLTTDLGLALALEVQASFREDLKILAMSATLDGLPLQTLMPEAASLVSEGRSFPVSLSYRPSAAHQDWLLHMAKVIVEAVTEHQEGSLLAFLPGQREIGRLQTLLSERLDSKLFLITPLYGALPPAQQDSAIAPPPPGMRKLVLATNVAESSLTIQDIRLVVDAGYKRQASFNPKTAVSRLSLKRISQSSAAQRSGRAGRLSEGHCIRLWPQQEHERLLKADEPEILHGDLTNAALDAAFWGVNALDALPLISPPSEANETVAWELLQALALVEGDRRITPHGRAAYRLGCHPRLAHMLLAAKDMDGIDAPYYLPLAAVLAALLESRALARRGADISRYLSDARGGEVAKLAQQYLARMNAGRGNQIAKVIGESRDQDIATLLALAFPDRIAKARGAKGYQLACGAGVALNDDDALQGEPWLVVADFQESEGQSSGRILLAAKLDAALFEGPLASQVKSVVETGWDEEKARFYGLTQRRIGAIILGERPLATLDEETIKQAIYQLIRTKGLSLLGFDDKVEQLRLRVALASKLALAGDWPDLSDQALLATLPEWLGPYLDGVRRLTLLKGLDFYTLLHNQMEWGQQQILNEALPSHWPMKTGTRAAIRYEMSGRALLSVRLQEALGMAESPRLAQGQLVVTMELLSPAMRPLALTADLANFWAGPYVEVKKEMKGRYPKHLWPDDPANTLPTKLTKKKMSAKGL
ncbi:ATP-dependent helicase HrpB [Shewanella spartinae]|uniref:ATP-dependent helicase HrpB n=1 Tax=Shewanella spartinae TaxID=2864205 RepID=UPI001C661159|nr:ATP-dependent helicase HrpB [Shewanella spartinae]QYJ93130.1 ATP-dependent helicase HrpB [Shewanella spartinae]